MNTFYGLPSSRRRALPALALGALLMTSGFVARADDKDGEVAVGGEHILTIYYPAGGLSIQERANKVTERLTEILGDPSLKPEDIKAMPNGKTEAKIMVKSTLLYTVDARTAKRNNTTPLKLAQTYADHLRVQLPKVNIKPNPGRGA